jgi:hypothetical protein
MTSKTETLNEMTYTITANNVVMGTYRGATASSAVLAYVRDAGYASVEDAAETLGQTVAEFLSDITVYVTPT